MVFEKREAEVGDDDSLQYVYDFRSSETES